MRTAVHGTIQCLCKEFLSVRIRALSYKTINSFFAFPFRKARTVHAFCKVLLYASMSWSNVQEQRRLPTYVNVRHFRMCIYHTTYHHNALRLLRIREPQVYSGRIQGSNERTYPGRRTKGKFMRHRLSKDSKSDPAARPCQRCTASSVIRYVLKFSANFPRHLIHSRARREQHSNEIARRRGRVLFRLWGEGVVRR